MTTLGALYKLARLKGNIRLQPHQADAVAEATDEDEEGGIILNWGLGSGKTMGAMAIAEQKGGNVLVVVPASLRENFKKQLTDTVEKKRRGSYTIISYDAFRKDPKGWVKKIKPTTLITDEMHRVRNPSPREPFEQVRDKIPFMVGLTGSLINNRPEELVPLVNLVAGRKVFDSTESFKRKHLDVDKVSPGIWGRFMGVKPGSVESAKNLRTLGKKLDPIVHRFVGDEQYRKQTPKVTEEVIRVQMDSGQEKLYKDLTKKNPSLAMKIRYGLPPSKRELKQLNAFMTAARQISNNPAGYAPEGEIPSPKFEAILSKIDEDMAGDKNHKAIIYSSFLESGVDPLVKSLKDRGIAAATFSGKLTDKKRRKLVSDFNKGKIQVLGLSPAGGEGLDLKGVKSVHIAEEHWNPERGSQATGRGTRYKSHSHLPEGERKVKVRRYFATHSPPGFWGRLFGRGTDQSADEWIDQRRREKKELNQQVLDSIEPFGKVAQGADVNTLATLYKLAFIKAGEAADGNVGGYSIPLFGIETPEVGARKKNRSAKIWHSRLSRDVAPLLPGGLTTGHQDTPPPPNQRV